MELLKSGVLKQRTALQTYLYQNIFNKNIPAAMLNFLKITKSKPKTGKKMHNVTSNCIPYLVTCDTLPQNRFCTIVLAPGTLEWLKDCSSRDRNKVRNSWLSCWTPLSNSNALIKGAESMKAILLECSCANNRASWSRTGCFFKTSSSKEKMPERNELFM